MLLHAVHTLSQVYIVYIVCFTLTEPRVNTGANKNIKRLNISLWIDKNTVFKMNTGEIFNTEEK